MAVEAHRYEVEGWGVGELWLREAVVVHHELPSFALDTGSDGGGSTALVDDVATRVRAHLAGVRTDYGSLELDLRGQTAFHCRLVETLRAVPWGEVVSYGELAALAGRPGAARAAGSMCAGNPFALVVPCHRVVAANGIGGYGTSGVELKRRLLALEGVEL